MKLRQLDINTSSPVASKVGKRHNVPQPIHFIFILRRHWAALQTFAKRLWHTLPCVRSNPVAHQPYPSHGYKTVADVPDGELDKGLDWRTWVYGGAKNPLHSIR